MTSPLAAPSPKPGAKKPTLHSKHLEVGDQPTMGKPQPLSLPHLLQSTVRAITVLCPDSEVGLYIISRQTQRLALRAWSTGYSPNPHAPTEMVTPGSGLIGYALSTCEPIIVDDVHASSQYRQIRSETRSELCIPLCAGKEVIGMINVEADREKAFTQRDIQVLTPLANVIANGILYSRNRDSATRFHQLVDHMNEAVWICDSHERTVYANKKLQELTEYSLDEMIGRESYNFLDEEGIQIVRRQNELERKAGRSSTYEANLKSKTGTIIPVFVSGAPLPDGGTVGIMTDLRKIRDTEARFRQLVEYMNEGILIINQDDRATYVNPRLCKWLEHPVEDLVGKYAYELTDSDGAKKLIEMRRTIGRERADQFEMNLKTRSGTSMPVIVSCSTMPNNEIAAIITNLTEVKEHESKIAELSKHDQLLAAISRYSVEAIVALDLNLRVILWNKTAEDMFGFSSEEIIGKPSTNIVPEDRLEEVDMLVAQCNRDGFINNYETSRVHKNGETVHVSLNASLLHDPKGRVVGYSVMYRDITLAKKRERDLRTRYEKMQEAYKELGRQRRQVDYLVDLIDVSIESHPINRVADFIASAAVMLTHADACSLRLYRSDLKQLELIATHGLGTDWLTKGSIIYPGSLVEAAVQQGMPLKVHDLSADPRYSAPGLVRKHGFVAAIVLPLIIKGSLLGSMTLYLVSGKEQSILDDEFIPVFANQSALALAMCRKDM